MSVRFLDFISFSFKDKYIVSIDFKLIDIAGIAYIFIELYAIMYHHHLPMMIISDQGCLGNVVIGRIYIYVLL